MYIQVCDDPHYPTCSTTRWAHHTELQVLIDTQFPDLTVVESTQLLEPIVLILVTAYIFKLLRDFILNRR